MVSDEYGRPSSGSRRRAIAGLNSTGSDERRERPGAGRARGDGQVTTGADRVAMNLLSQGQAQDQEQPP